MEFETIKTANPAWLEICGEPDHAVVRDVHQRVRTCVESGEFTWDEVAYVAAVSMKAGNSNLNVTDEQLEKIRRACQLWDVDIRLREISSHRPIIGPVIIAAKKVLYPILQAFLKDFIRQQRSFNAAALALIIDKYSEEELDAEPPTSR